MKFIRDIISEKKQSILKQSQVQTGGDNSFDEASVGEEPQTEPMVLPKPDAPLVDTETASTDVDTLMRTKEPALQDDDIDADEDFSNFSNTLRNVFADDDVNADEFEEGGDNALPAFDNIVNEIDELVDEVKLESQTESATDVADAFDKPDLQSTLAAHENSDDNALLDKVQMDEVLPRTEVRHQKTDTTTVHKSEPEKGTPRQDVNEDPADNPFSTPAGHWNSIIRPTTDQVASPPRYRPVPGEVDTGRVPPPPRAMTQPPEMSSALQPVDVPAPASGRVSSRATRVKTRLLGFNPSKSAVADPFSTGADQTSSDHTKFPVGWLAVVRGPGRGATFTIFAGVTHLGRGEGQGVRLDFGDNSISRSNHAAVAYDPELQKFYIGHGGKANLVRRNDLPVLNTEELLTGDLIRVGETTLRFVALCGPDFGWEDHRESDFRHVSNS